VCFSIEVHSKEPKTDFLFHSTTTTVKKIKMGCASTKQATEWLQMVYSIPGTYRGVTMHVHTRTATYWNFFSLNLICLDLKSQKALFKGEGLGLFQQKLVPFEVTLKVDKNHIRILKDNVWLVNERPVTRILRYDAHVSTEHSQIKFDLNHRSYRGELEQTHRFVDQI
jgi:hypothetical protein